MAQTYGAAREFYFNTDQRCLCDASGTPLPAANRRIIVTSFGKYVFKMTFLRDSAVASDAWSGQVAFWATVDSNYDHTSAGYVSVLNAAFNVAGDWVVTAVEQPDPETGKLCCRVDFADARMDTALGSTAKLDCDLEIHGLRSGESRGTCILRIPLTVENVQQTDESVAEPTSDALYVSHSEFAGLIAAKADQADLDIAEAAILTKAPIAAVRHVFLPANLAISRTTNGALWVPLELATNDVMQGTFDFDKDTDEAVQYSTYLEHWNLGTIKFKPVWTAASGTGTACWSVSARALANDDAQDAAFGTPQTSTDTLITANDEHIGPASSAITVAGTLAAGQRLQVQVLRDISEDTLDVDAKLVGVWIEYTEATAIEAVWP
jgi:hypothetical protein